MNENGLYFYGTGKNERIMKGVAGARGAVETKRAPQRKQEIKVNKPE